MVWLELLGIVGIFMLFPAAGYLYYRVRLHEAKQAAEHGVHRLMEHYRIDPRTITGTAWDKTRGVTIHTSYRSYSEWDI